MRDRRVVILFLTLFTVMVGFGVIIPVLPFYVLHFGASSLHLGLLMATFSLMQFICAPYWGTLSDRVGRRPVLLVGLGGYVLSFVIMALANDLWVLFLARVVGGGLSSATLPTALAYIGDTTSHRDRGSGMGLMGAAMGLGMIFGPAIGGGLAAFGITAPFFFSAGLTALVFAFAYFALPESLADKGCAGGARGGMGVRLQEIVFALRGQLAAYYLVSFIVSFGMANLEGIFAFFAKDRLGYGPTEMGIIFVIMGIIGVLVQGVAVGHSINRLGEERVLRIGLVLGAVGFFLLTLVWDMPSLLVAVAIQGVGIGVLRPATSSLLSKRATLGQGATMGLQGSFDSLGRVVGPVWGGFTYGLPFAYAIDLPFLTGGTVFLLALAVMYLFAGATAVGRPAPAPPEQR